MREKRLLHAPTATMELIFCSTVPAGMELVVVVVVVVVTITLSQRSERVIHGRSKTQNKAASGVLYAD